MKITHVMTQIVETPADEPLANGPMVPGAKRPFVLVKLATADGTEGLGVTFFGGAMTKALRQAVEDLGRLVVGEDAAHVERIHAKLRDAANMTGAAGVFTLAISALDTALWDIRAKALGVSVSRMLGGHRDVVPAYASGALMRHFTLDEVLKASRVLVERGWKAMKTQLALPGHTTPDIEVDRIRRQREAIGPDIQLMCDINQRWTPWQAISIGRRIEDCHLRWLEDVTRADDFQGLAEVSRALDMPVAGGEYVWGIEPFRQMLEMRSVDIAMIDLVRVGGLTQWMKVAGMAEAFNIPVVSHLIPEVHVHLIAAIPNGEIVEYMPWTRSLFEDPVLPEDGTMRVPSAPGLGLRFARNIDTAFKAS
ncbi:MAG: mandelate racemase/muconate lactonizing enzyme family protein [Hyphomicrobiaceae bacterium]